MLLVWTVYIEQKILQCPHVVEVLRCQEQLGCEVVYLPGSVGYRRTCTRILAELHKVIQSP